MQIAFYKAEYGNWQDKLIAALTNSDYSHCEIVLSFGVCVSASPRDGGVRFKDIDLGTGHWDLYEILKDVNEEQVINWFKSVDYQHYDWIGAIGTLFNADWTSKHKKFCSQCCAIVLGDDPIQTPEDLRTSLISKGLINLETGKVNYGKKWDFNATY